LAVHFYICVTEQLTALPSFGLGALIGPHEGAPLSVRVPSLRGALSLAHSLFCPAIVADGEVPMIVLAI
jgi:hypothetical protein